MAAETPPRYRFMPWSRRGLAAFVQRTDAGGDLLAHAPLRVAITLSGASAASVDLSLYGPGDVIGIDSRVIVRTEPRAHSTDVEPNYLAAIEFDLPDLPWMFTPGRADSNQRLRPWCVLVVLDQAKVSGPRMSRGAPLPTITIPADLVGTELPDLSESWAWAHVQAFSEETQPAALGKELASKPYLSVSRLLCPRRLEPGKHYHACLVPAFDLGVQRGLGATPSGNLARPAWEPNQRKDVTLPVYFHWEFGTGPAGDFESLARKLTPTTAPADIGYQRMFIGEPRGGVPSTAANSESAYIRMEGVLRAPKASDSTLAEVPSGLRTGLQKALGASARLSESPDTALTPPLYGEWHLNRHDLTGAGVPPWMSDLNLDPRMRSAAGLGAEVVRQNQEDFMQACWEQVGDVVRANELLNRARLAQELLQRLYERHFQRLPPERLVQVAAPLHARTSLGDLTVRGRIARTSLPDAGMDPALRRMVSPQRSWLKRVVRKVQPNSLSSRSARINLTARLAEGKLEVDPTRFMPDGLTSVSLVESIAARSGTSVVDLSEFGIQARLSTVELQKLTSLSRTLGVLQPQQLPKLQVSSKLIKEGVVRGLEVAPQSTPAQSPVVTPTQPVVTMPVTVQPVITQPVITQPVTAQPVINKAVTAQLTTNKVVTAQPVVNKVVTAQPVVNKVVTAQPVVTKVVTAQPVINQVATTQPVVTKVVTVQRYQNALKQLLAAAQVDQEEPQAVFVPFELGNARDVLLKRMEPRIMVPRRVRSMLSGEGGVSLNELLGVTPLPQFDRVMVAPEIDAPMYSFLVRYDHERFVPGIGKLPADSMTLLETNQRFIEAFMVGLNYEMSRELLWRGYPTDQRGTVLRHFWDWVDGAPDLTSPIHHWTKGALGKHVRGPGAGGQVVLLLRGQLLRRYPNTIIYAWRAKGDQLMESPGPEDILEPVFQGQFEPDVSFAGFSLTDTDLTTGDGWFFVLQEQPTEPRFGFDETTNKSLNELKSWADVAWSHTGVRPGGHLVLKSSPLKGKLLHGVQFDKNSAHLAHITLQKPMRVAIHGKHMVQR